MTWTHQNTCKRFHNSSNDPKQCKTILKNLKTSQQGTWNLQTTWKRFHNSSNNLKKPSKNPHKVLKLIKTLARGSTIPQITWKYPQKVPTRNLNSSNYLEKVPQFLNWPLKSPKKSKKIQKIKKKGLELSSKQLKTVAQFHNLRESPRIFSLRLQNPQDFKKEINIWTRACWPLPVKMHGNTPTRKKLNTKHNY